MNDELHGDIGRSLAAVAASFSVGSRVAGYRLEEQIGRGGMAIVFRALDERLGFPAPDRPQPRAVQRTEGRTRAPTNPPHRNPKICAPPGLSLIRDRCGSHPACGPFTTVVPRRATQGR